MQTTAASTPPATGAQPSPGRTSRRRTSTPAQLRTWQVIIALVAVTFALLGAYGVNRRAGQLDETRQAASQLIAVQDIGVAVVRADAIASSSYLAGGQEDPASRSAYLAAVDQASNQLVAVANGLGGGDDEQLAEASRLLGKYVGLIEQARANNRQGFPVGAAYQREANALVSNDDPRTTDILAVLRTVEGSQRDHLNSSLRAAHRAGVWFNALGWVLLIAVALGALWLAGRFRRLLNLPLAVAALALLLLLLIGGARQATAMRRADRAVSGAVAAADLAAQARAAGFDARSQEALGLINRGNAGAYEQRWEQASAVAFEALHRCGPCADAAVALQRYGVEHKALRETDNNGDWDTAVAISLGKQSNLVSLFESFGTSTDAVIADNVSRADQRLAGASSSLDVVRFVTLIGGLLVAALGVAGFGQRIKEYR